MNNREIAEHCTNTIWKHISEGTYNDLIDAITQALDEKDRYKDEFCEALLEDKKSIVSILKAENTAIREERGDTLTDQLRQGWLCFHCGERFHTFGAAEDHFGATPESVAGCLIITSEDRGILMALRRTEAQVATLREALEEEIEINKKWLDCHDDWQEQMARLKRALDKYRYCQRRMLEKWADGDQHVKNELWTRLHACEDEATEALAAVPSLATSKDTEGSLCDRGHIPASAVGNEAVPSGPRSSDKGLSPLSDNELVITARVCSVCHSRPCDWDRHPSNDNKRVMDLIRHCLDLSAQDEKLRMSFNDRKYCRWCNYMLSHGDRNCPCDCGIYPQIVLLAKAACKNIVSTKGSTFLGTNDSPATVFLDVETWVEMEEIYEALTPEARTILEGAAKDV